MNSLNIPEVFEGKIDFEGQKLADQIVRVTLTAITVISFIVGFAMQSLTITFGTFGVATLALCAVVIPPWPMFNKHPVAWLPVQDTKKKQ